MTNRSPIFELPIATLPIGDTSVDVKMDIKSVRDDIISLNTNKWSITGANGHSLTIGNCTYGGDLKHIAACWNLFNLNGQLFAPHFRYYQVNNGNIELRDSLSTANAAKIANENYTIGRDSIDVTKDGLYLILLQEKDVEQDLRDLGYFIDLDKEESKLGRALSETEKQEFGKRWIEQECILAYLKQGKEEKTLNKHVCPCYGVPMQGSMQYLMLLHSKLNAGRRSIDQNINLFRQSLEMKNERVLQFVKPFQDLEKTSFIHAKLARAVESTPTSRKITTRVDGPVVNNFFWDLPAITPKMVALCLTEMEKLYLVSSFAILGYLVPEFICMLSRSTYPDTSVFGTIRLFGARILEIIVDYLPALGSPSIYFLLSVGEPLLELFVNNENNISNFGIICIVENAMESGHSKKRKFSKLTDKKKDCLVKTDNNYIFWLLHGFIMKKFNFIDIENKHKYKNKQIHSNDHKKRWNAAVSQYDVLSTKVWNCWINYVKNGAIDPEIQQLLQTPESKRILQLWKRRRNCKEEIVVIDNPENENSNSNMKSTKKLKNKKNVTSKKSKTKNKSKDLRNTRSNDKFFR